jgi:hypothetical protein
MTGVHHLTREAEATIRRCHRVFVVDPSLGVAEHLRSLGPEVVDLLPFYEPGRPRIETYRRMAAATVTAALDRPPVGFATYGHPWMYCYPTALLHEAARLLDLRVDVVAGVSTLDTLLVDLGHDPSADGLQLYEATDLLLRRRPLQDDVALVLVQVSALAEPTFRPGPTPVDRLRLLQDYLLEVYPPGHTVLSVYSRTHPAMRSVVERHRLDGLAETLAGSPQSGTLFVPPARRRPVVDEDLLETIVARAEPAAPASPPPY